MGCIATLQVELKLSGSTHVRPLVKTDHAHFVSFEENHLTFFFPVDFLK